MAGDRPRICTAVTTDDISLIERAAPYTDYYELRIDHIGNNWQQLAKKLSKPWIATNRRREEGGVWSGGEEDRIATLISSLALKPAMIDIELQTPLLQDTANYIKGKAELIISYHDFQSTPSLDELEYIIVRMRDAGADICKVVTTACSMDDNIRILQLAREFRGKKLACFAMGEPGMLSRVLAPLAGSCLTYASLGTGVASAPGQMNVSDMRKLYELIDAV